MELIPEATCLAASEIPNWIGAVTAVLGVVFVVRQLRDSYAQRDREQKWKRAEFVAEKMKEFFDQRQVQTAMWLLDYSQIRLLPDGTRPGANTPADQAFTIDDKIIESSLADHTEFPGEMEAFGPEQMLCREALDAWLTGLETFDHYVQADLVTVADLKPYLGYWIEKMADPSTKWKDPSFYRRLAQFIEGYQYKGVQHLCQRMGFDISTKAATARP